MNLNAAAHGHTHSLLQQWLIPSDAPPAVINVGSIMLLALVVLTLVFLVATSRRRRGRY